jgi:dihydropteroate synthase
MLNSAPPKVMGVLNITPDSFSDGGFYFSPEKATEQVASLIEEGVDIIDIGGESTRPGAVAVTLDEELSRVVPVIEAIRSRFDVDVSIDTSKAGVMTAAVQAGATMINDVFALRKEGALEAAAKAGVKICLMHMQGEPETMQEAPRYSNLLEEINDFFKVRVEMCQSAGIDKSQLILDPGIGFGKTHPQNLQILANLERLKRFELPLLLGISRKSVIGNIVDRPVNQRMIGSVAVATLAAWQGVSIIRVHDVRETVEALAVCSALQMERI